MLARLGSRNSVCLSNACFVTKKEILQIFWYHTKGQSRPLPPEICAQSYPLPFEICRHRQISVYNISTVRYSEQRFKTCVQKKSTTGFPLSYRWSAYVTSISLPKSQKAAQKAIFCFLKIKFNFSRMKSAYKVSLCENFQWQSWCLSCSIRIQRSIDVGAKRNPSTFNLASNWPSPLKSPNSHGLSAISELLVLLALVNVQLSAAYGDSHMPCNSKSFSGKRLKKITGMRSGTHYAVNVNLSKQSTSFCDFQN